MKLVSICQGSNASTLEHAYTAYHVRPIGPVIMIWDEFYVLPYVTIMLNNMTLYAAPPCFAACIEHITAAKTT